MHLPTAHDEEPMNMDTAARRKPVPAFLKGLGLVALSGLLVGYTLHARVPDEASAPATASAAFEAEAPVANASEAAAAPASRRQPPRPDRAAALAAVQYGNLPSDVKVGLARLHASVQTDPAAVAAKREQVVASMEAQYRAEPVDPQWSAASEQLFTTAAQSQVMAEAEFQPQGVTSECRSSSCRISATFDNAVDAKDWADRMLTQMGETIASARTVVLPQPDGRFEVRVFGARKAS